MLASVDAKDNAISFYAYRDGGFVRLIGSLTTGQLPAQIIAADLSGDGWDDLVVRNAGDGTLSVFFVKSFIGPVNPHDAALGIPTFLPPVTLPVGLGVSDVQAVDTTGSGTLDLVVTNKLTGQVSVLYNLGNGTFAPPVPYRAGTGLSADRSRQHARGHQPGSDGGRRRGTAHAGRSDRPGDDQPRLEHARRARRPRRRPLRQSRHHPDREPGPGRPRGRLHRQRNRRPGRPHRRWREHLSRQRQGGLPAPDHLRGAVGIRRVDRRRSSSATASSTSWSATPMAMSWCCWATATAPSQPYHEANQAVELAVADLTGNGSKDIIYADQGLDRVVVDYGAGNSNVLANQSTGLLDPGAVKLADLNGDGIPDLIVANSGSNNVLIYPGLGNGQFGPAINDGNGYFVGTNPVGITVANLTGALPDLVVADEGSNQVSILLNQSQPGGAISFSAGPRLNSGGSGPVSTVVGNFTGGTFPDLLVTNSQSERRRALAGSGTRVFQ